MDHKLRPGSTAEADAVARAVASIAVEHRILTWSGRKPATGLQSAARNARHRLLAELAEQERAVAVLVGHTEDDQVETVIMRRQRGEGPGLAGIAPATLYDRRVWFVRPLLHASRAALRLWLSVRGVGWIDDPSNDNPDFERVAVRQGLAASVDRVVRTNEALDVAQNAARMRAAVAQDAAVLLEQARFESNGGVSFDRGMLLRHGETEGWLQAFRILLAAAGGTDHLPDRQRSGDLLARVSRAAVGERFSFSRCVIALGRDAMAIRREQRRGTPDHGLTRTRPTPWGQFLPVFDLPSASALARLTGGVVPPSPPWQFG